MFKQTEPLLSTRVAADISVKLVQGIFNPIAAQIEPLKLAEMQRATAITLSYGQRLAETGKNLLPNGLETLIGGYPSHGFVIDRKEARGIFSTVKPPDAHFKQLCYDFQQNFGSKVNDNTPHVALETIEVQASQLGASNDNADPTAGEAAAGSAANKPAFNDNGSKARRSAPQQRGSTGKAGYRNAKKSDQSAEVG